MTLSVLAGGWGLCAGAPLSRIVVTRSWAGSVDGACWAATAGTNATCPTKARTIMTVRKIAVVRAGEKNLIHLTFALLLVSNALA